MLELRKFIEESRANGLLIDCDRILSPKHEMGAFMEKLENSGSYKAVLFHKVAESNMPVISNVFASRSNAAIAFGCGVRDINEIYRTREQKRVKPVIVNDAPVHDIVMQGDEVNLNSLPILWHNDGDAGPYITCGAMVVKDPETGIRNIGVYRHQLYEKNKIGIHMNEANDIYYIWGKYQTKGERMPVAITIGHHPLFYYGVLATPPVGTDEYEIVGALAQEPLRITPCITVPLEVPAEAEIVLEGFIDPEERREEGPFGEFTTLYGSSNLYPAVTITAVTMRENPIYMDCFSGHADHQLMGGIGRLSTIYKAVRKSCPTVKDVLMPVSGCCRLSCYIQIKKRHEGEAKNAIAAVFGCDTLVKYCVAVDEDVDIYDDSQVIKAICTRLHPDQDSFIIKNVKGHPLDPTASVNKTVTKVGIDATRDMVDKKPTVCATGFEDIDISEYLD